MFQVTQRNGARFSAADAYLRPARAAAQPRGPHRRARARRRARRASAPSASASPAGRGPVAHAARRARGDPLRGRDPVAAAPAAERDRAAGRAARGRRRAAPRAARRRAQPAGPPVRDGHLGDLGHRHAATAPSSPRYLAEWVLRRSGPLTSTVAEVVRVRAHARRAARGRHPVPHGRRLLRGPRRGDLRRPLRGDRARARLAAGARPGLAALGRPRRQAAHPHQLARRARRRPLARRRACCSRARSPSSRRCAT